MKNYVAIKGMDIEELAGLLTQITSCAKTSTHTPSKEEWKDYLLSNDMFLPFGEVIPKSSPI